MPLSTFSSSPVPALVRSQVTLATRLLLALLVFLLGGTEIITRFIILPKSRVHRRILEDRAEAASLGSRDVLVVGNSLLNLGLDLASFQQSLGAEWGGHRFVVESTNFSDWYFGLKRLFDEGSRPRAVAVTLTARQLGTREVLDDYFGFYLMGLRDAFDVARQTNMHPTALVSMLVGHFSAFYGVRGDLRKFLLTRIYPGLPALARSWNHPAPLLMAERAYQRALPNLRELKELGDRYGAKVVVIIPPLLDSPDNHEAVQRAGREAGITVLVPVSTGSLGSDCFDIDRYHLNEKGRQVFTLQLAKVLKGYLGTL